MAKVAPIQGSFDTGEVSPLLYGRTDSERYKRALAICKNYIPTVQGGLVRRPGSVYVAEVKDSTKKVRLERFEFSTTQAYVIEFGHLYVRFYKDNGQIESAGTPVEVVTPYTEADIFQLSFTQSADVLYITHPDYEPRKLSRTSHVAWTLSVITLLDGPYLPTNTDVAFTLTPSATTGTITITANTAFPNPTAGVGFATTDVGRLVRIKQGATWGYARITVRTSNVLVTAVVVSAFAATTASDSWRLGLWSETTGYPRAITFHEDRLFMGGSDSNPLRFDGSKTGDYENFAPTATDGSVADNNAVGFSLNSNGVNAIQWMTSDEKGLLLGTTRGEWAAKASSSGAGITPTDIDVKPASSWGSKAVQPVQSGKATVFVARAGRKLREMTYFYDVDGFRCPDVTRLAEHITESGVTQLAIQTEPQPVVWAVRTDGVLAGMMYERDEDALIVGWHRHVLGGSSDAAGSAAVVESVAVIPSADGTSEDVWLAVKRYVDGAVVRTVEYLAPIFSDTVEQKDAFFVDCGLTYDNPLTITGITKANPAVVSSTAHGLSNGESVLLSDIVGMTELNGESFVVAGVAANTFQLVGVNSTAYADYVSGGEARKYVTTLSGLDHLEGQSVDILADGAVQPAKTVTGGAITLSTRATTVHVGYGYQSDGKLLPIDAGAADGTSIGKIRRTHKAGFMLHRSLGLKVGMDFDALSPVVFRTAADSMSRAPALFSGIKLVQLSGDYDFYNQICWRQDQPLPSTLLAIMPRMTTQDG